MISLLDLKRRLLAMPGYCKGDAAANAGMNEAAMLQAETGKEALEWFKAEYANTADERDAANTRANAISDAQLATMNQQNAIAKDYYDYSKDTFRPLEQRMVTDAQNYDTPERREAAAATAAADVQMAADTQRNALSRSLQRSGVAPDSTASQVMMQRGGLETARMSAGAQNAARKEVETVGHARMMDAASLGRNLPSAQTAAVQTGTSAGNSSVGASQQALGSATSGADMLSNGFNTAMSGYKGSGQLYSQMATNASNASASSWGSLGSVIGAGLGAYASYAAMVASDEKLKTNTGKRAKTARMLEQVDSVPVEEGWKYDPAKGGPDDGGIPHDGPMAGDVQRVMGNEVAPGGRMIDLVSMNGRTIGAVQELSKRVKRIEARMSA